jgi:hypothetical protein
VTTETIMSNAHVLWKTTNVPLRSFAPLRMVISRQAGSGKPAVADAEVGWYGRQHEPFAVQLRAPK